MPRLREPKDLQCSWRLEERVLGRGLRSVAGTDEAGRGCLLGPLYVAAVILDQTRRIPGIDDSKKLSAQQRSNLAMEIREKALAYKVVAVPASQVDALNIYEATRRAMIQSLLALDPHPEFVLTDAMRLQSPGRKPGFTIPYWAIIHGDARSVSIAAASILAKVDRDAHLDQLDRQYPQYCLARNKGYGTRAHLEALARYGPCPEHRRTYQPVKDLLVPRLPFASA
ncbi:MAG: ribonuclease HII [Acidobacteria bacterium]|nr:ribonuclease HII [Acidobacteriota bacterium]